ncbi:hypothetical protein CHCC20335_0945 [Bacillus paralicheniformis]|nr:hypothetical protein CHCC20335_0945 [Bacillus paralicheniformis]
MQDILLKAGLFTGKALFLQMFPKVTHGISPFAKMLIKNKT